MAAWPTLDVLKGQLGIDNSSQDTVLQLALDAAIEQVKQDVSGTVTEFATDFADGPTSSLSMAALTLAVMAAKAPDAPYGVAAVFDMGGLKVAAEHPTYRRLLAGHYHSFSLG
jgi:hypothetical protein